MYTLQGKTWSTWHVRFPRQSTYVLHMLPVGSPCMWQPFIKLSTAMVRCTTPEKKCSRLYPSARLSGPQDPPQFLSQHSHWRSALKPITCWQQTTRLTGPISLACDTFVQYLLMGTNPSVLNRHRRGLPHRNLRIATTLSPFFPSECSTDPPNSLVRSQNIHPTITNWTGERTNPKSHEWEPPLDFYSNLPSKHSVDVWSSDIWSRIGGNVSRWDQSHVNTKHEILDWFRPSRGVIALRPVLIYYAIEIDSSLFLSGSFGGFPEMSSVFFGLSGCPWCGSILSIYSQGTAS
jgi:hypothetical protein